jgi:hypothetical protein
MAWERIRVVGFVRVDNHECNDSGLLVLVIQKTFVRNCLISTVRSFTVCLNTYIRFHA